MRKFPKLLKIISSTLAFLMISECFFPSVAMALTSGPASPEFSSFEPVATTDMVNVFSGDFTYNLPVIEIPGNDGSGYAMSLSYHSGSNSEEEASWVGFGWTLNPGAINRSVKGYPDDYMDTPVKQYNKTKPNWTISGQQKLNLEFYSQESNTKHNKDPKKEELDVLFSIGAGTGLRYNNNMGFNRSRTLSAGFMGMASLDITSSSTGLTFSADVNPTKILRRYKKVKQDIENGAAEKAEAAGRESEVKTEPAPESKKGQSIVKSPVKTYDIFSSQFSPSAVSTSPYGGYNFNYSLSGMLTGLPVPIGVHLGTTGGFSMQYNLSESMLEANGYLNAPDIAPSTVLPTLSQSNNKVSDFYMEKDNPFDMQDLVLGIPFSSPDNFILSGEALGGSFRPWQKQIGTYHPNKLRNKLIIFNLGLALNGIVDLGVGMSFGSGYHQNMVDDWESKFSSSNSAANYYKFNDGSNAESSVFRFASDLGGQIEYGNNNVNDQTNENSMLVSFPGLKHCLPNIDHDAYGKYLNGYTDGNEAHRNSGRSSDVEPGFTASVLDKFSVTASNGNKYVYGKALLAKNETNIAVDTKCDPSNGQPYATIINNSLVYKPLFLNDDAGDYDIDVCNGEHEVVQGEIRPEPYAYTYLLTAIYTPDYFSYTVGNDLHEFGGWTKFGYREDGQNDFYRWRSPYTGLEYHKNKISDPTDDMASVSTGERKLAYLSKVETKTHIAFFVTNKSIKTEFIDANAPISLDEIEDYVTGSQIDRLDGLGALPLTGPSEDAAINPASKNTTKKLEFLERIVLFAKNEDGSIASTKPIKVVHFDYEYFLVRNTPNNINGTYPVPITTNTDLSGKLTLKRVWFEAEGIKSIKISPYKFEYNYRDWDASDVVSQHPELSDFFSLNSTYTGNAQNPFYTSYLLDAWTNVQPRGHSQNDKMRTWPWQGEVVRADDYDPGAWQLKRIVLPSGGEILVQYEEKDYQYVQDRHAMSMVSLNYASDGGGSGISENPVYRLNMNDLGVDNSVDLSGLATSLQEYFVTDSNMIYFKFLFGLKDHPASLSSIRSEYIDGYARVKAVSLVGQDIQIELDGHDASNNQNGYYVVPRQGCYDFFKSNRIGKFSNGAIGKYDSKYGNALDGLALSESCGQPNAKSVISVLPKVKFLFKALIEMQVDVMNSNIKTPEPTEVCLDMSNENSYLKIPIFFKAKRGGGCRVKRLLIYDEGQQTGAPVIYGNVYDYVLEDGHSSSGVATNEPMKMREENALVEFFPKKHQGWLNRHIVGVNKEQSEGPIGESLLPGASVGHSRVVVHNIFSGKNGSGFSVHEFYTCKDYPFDKGYNYSVHTKLSEQNCDDFENELYRRSFDIGGSGSEAGVKYSSLSENTVSDHMNIPAPFFSFMKTKKWATQGFRFILNNMHSQPISVRNYYGEYVPGSVPSSDPSVLSSATLYQYYEPGENIRVLKPDQNGLSDRGTYSWKCPGKEMEVTMESHSIRDNSVDFSMGVDLCVGLIFFPPISVGFSPNVALSDKSVSTHSTSKVIRYPVILKSITNTKDGIESKSEQLAFDESGVPVLTRTTDSYHGRSIINNNNLDGSYFALKLPAYWFYPEMGKKSEAYAAATPLVRTNQLSSTAGTILTYGNGAIPFAYPHDPNSANSFGWQIPLNRVVSATANTYETINIGNDWYDEDVLSEFGTTLFYMASQPVWRAASSYVYQSNDVIQSSDIPSGSDPLHANFIYNGGILSQNYVPFNYQQQTVALPWQLTSRTTKYSPHGQAIEEVDNRNIFSAAKYGYQGNSLPIMIAKNAEYSSILFNDYEYPVIVGGQNIAHSGTQSLLVPASSEIDLMPQGANLIKWNDHLQQKGGVIKLWISSNGNLDVSTSDFLLKDQFNNSYKAEKISRTGAWTLFEVKIKDKNFSLGTTLELSITNLSFSDLFADDFRFQPQDASATCYVYDIGTYKPVAQFDDQHFGMYFQYNSAGKLVRKLVETVHGLKTIQETQYNTPTVLQ